MRAISLWREGMSVYSAGWAEGVQRTKKKLLQQNTYSDSPVCEHGCFWHKKKMSSRNINREMRSRSRMRCPLCVYPKIKTLLHKEKQQSLQNVTWEVEEVRAFLSGIVFVWHTHKWDLTDIVQRRFTLQVPASEGSLPGQTDKPVERGP